MPIFKIPDRYTGKVLFQKDRAEHADLSDAEIYVFRSAVRCRVLMTGNITCEEPNVQIKLNKVQRYITFTHGAGQCELRIMAGDKIEAEAVLSATQAMELAVWIASLVFPEKKIT